MLTRNIIRRNFGALKHAEAAFWDMLYPRSIVKHSVRHMEVREDQVRHYNSPSQASDPVDKEDAFYDYRTAFKESHFNVRHSDHTEEKDLGERVSFLPVGLSKAEYLVTQGILSEEDKNDPKAYQAACDEYLKVTGFTMDKSYHIIEGVDNENNERMLWMPEDLQGKKDRIRSLIQSTARARETQQSHNRKQIYNTHKDYVRFGTWDSFEGHPKYRQLLVDIAFMYDSMQGKFRNEKKLTLYKGSTKRWTVLDDSHSHESKHMAQKAVGDQRSVPAGLEDGNHAIQIRKEQILFVEDNDNEEVIELPLKSNFL